MKPAPTITVSNKTLISFVIPIYNSSEYINRTIESIKNSVNKREDYEIILVDDSYDDIDIIENIKRTRKSNKKYVNQRENYEIILVKDFFDDIDIIENKFKTQKNKKIKRKNKKNQCIRI